MRVARLAAASEITKGDLVLVNTDTAINDGDYVSEVDLHTVVETTDTDAGITFTLVSVYDVEPVTVTWFDVPEDAAFLRGEQH